MNTKYCEFPNWKPELWNENIPKDIKKFTNCYSYALNRFEFNHTKKLQPGEINGKKYNKIDCDVIIEHIKKDLNRNDIYLTTFNSKLNCLQRKIALAIDVNSKKKDYHFYREDNNKTWSHKPGSSDVTNKDASNNIIYNPEKADRDYSYKKYKNKDGTSSNGKIYDIFCGFIALPINNSPIIKDWESSNEYEINNTISESIDNINMNNEFNFKNLF